MAEIDSFITAGEDMDRGIEGYIRYAHGVGILRNPELLGDFGRRQYENDPRGLVISAHRIMIDGIKRVIKYSNPPALRYNFRQMKDSFISATPNMWNIVDRACEDVSSKERLDKIDPEIVMYRPAPMLDNGAYNNICYGWRKRLTPDKILDGFPVSTRLERFVKDVDSSQWSSILTLAEEISLDPKALEEESVRFMFDQSLNPEDAA